MEELAYLLDLKKHYDNRVNSLNNFFATLLSIMVGGIPLMKQVFVSSSHLKQFFIYASGFAIYINVIWVYSIIQCAKSLKNVHENLRACAQASNTKYLQAQLGENKYSLILRKELSLPLGFMLISGVFAVLF